MAPRRSIPLRQPPATAGIHPAAPVRAFSHRTAYTSARALNRSANNASLSRVGEAMVTSPGGSTGADNCSGAADVSAPRSLQQTRQPGVLRP
ncbi:hypothetical protein [Verrucosispora sp. FIM060022]|uniref:hypothetical protein n=1 Tax=Verrucosispora sp. FIM060022 TaxID=1479020 RepID=UPI00131536D1|nr:hypothetical protein [Verrucosispora sp. FIM060022]